MLLSIGIPGDFCSSLRSHQATNDALLHAADALGVSVCANWLPTPSLEGEGAKERLARQDAIFAAPGSPYQSMEGMLAGIGFARACGVPFVGTCGGFQYALIEYARHVLDLADANTDENGVPCAHPIITPVACPVPGRHAGAPKLCGVRKLLLRPDTLLARICGSTSAHEEYFCNFEVNAKYESVFEQSGLVPTAIGEQGEWRAVELPGHPFFVATLFQPQLGSVEGYPHPLMVAFLKAAVNYRGAAAGELLPSRSGRSSVIALD